MNIGNFFDPIHGSPVKGCIYYLKIAIALAVAAIPEGLPAVITTCLALGTRKMAKNNCIVRRFASVETLGCTSVICSDKTGTLTKNEMCAVHFATYNDAGENVSFSIEEKSYSPEAQIHGLSSEAMQSNPNFRHISSNLALNCFARITNESGKYGVIGSTTEGALKVFSAKLATLDNKWDGLKAAPLNFFEQMEQTVTRVATLEFSSERKTMSTVVKGYEGSTGNTVFLKGAGDRVLQKCTHLSKAGTPQELDDSQRKKILNDMNSMERQGLRVLGLAYEPTGGNMHDVSVDNKANKLNNTDQYDNLESEQWFLGYVCIKDPCRPEVKPAIVECKTAGISVIMITGDAKATAIAIAKELGILEPGQ